MPAPAPSFWSLMMSMSITINSSSCRGLHRLLNGLRQYVFPSTSATVERWLMLIQLTHNRKAIHSGLCCLLQHVCADFCCSLGWKNLPHRRLFEQNQKHMLTSLTFWMIVSDTEETFRNYCRHACFPENPPPVQCRRHDTECKLKTRAVCRLLGAGVVLGIEWEQTKPAMRWLNMCRADEDQTKDSRNASVVTRTNVFDLCF